ncbi:hypothetical protein DFH11DRAFT_1747615 [Phellopilus nigrolimitatus]|nr:hypothetical protein DFH11DRAFT_1747615 [Phellopilus nigrolimitatus]
MDRIESLGNALSQVSMYDIKSMYNQAKNMVLNVTEMEAKVREATNDDPWGASSTLMQEIAQGTFNFQQFNEIMPCIYSRFMDKEARQWREIYKSLQLLEYIIKHGSERVVDDARSHLSTIKMLRNFHYIDDKGKDQGINVRNRAKEIAELLMDVDRIRTERRKAKANRNKYIGTGNDAMSYTGGSGGRYGGFGNDSLGSGSRSYGGGYDQDNGGYSGGSSSGFRDDAGGRRGYDEYNAGDDEVTAPRRSNSLASGSSARTTTTPTPAPAPAKAPAKYVDLLGFGDEDPFSAPVSAPAPVAAAKPAEKALPALASNPLDDGDDDFADFQAAPSSATIAPAAPIAPVKGNVFDVLGSVSAAQRPVQAVQPVQSGFNTSAFQSMSPTSNRSSFASPVQAASPSVFGSAPAMSPTSPPPMVRPTATGTTSFSTPSTTSAGTQAKRASASVGFDDLWNMSLGSSGTPKRTASGAGGAKSMKDLEKEKVQASIWGGGGQHKSSASMGMGSGLGGLGSTAGTSASSAGADDLLL